jgi:hypothetical protein
VKEIVDERVKLLLVPVTVTTGVPADVKVHDREEVPEPVTLVGDNVHAPLFDVSATAPVNPFDGLMVMVDVPGEPEMTVTLVGEAEMAKS